MKSLTGKETGLNTGIWHAGSRELVKHGQAGLKTGEGTGKVHAGSSELALVLKCRYEGFNAFCT